MNILSVQERPPESGTRWTFDATALAAIAVVVLALYLWAYPLHGLHEAVGFDAPVYVWWARRAGAIGLSASNTGSRPATVALIAGLAGVLHTSPGLVVAVIE